MGPDDAVHRLRGAIDAEVLFGLREEFHRQAPFATATVDDVVNPTVLTVALTASLRPAADTTGRFDVQWTTEGDYKLHYTEPDLDFRWGHHPHGGAYDVPDDAHFHPPPYASRDPADVEASCFSVHRPRLVVRGVLTNWRAAYQGGLDELNRPAYSG